MHKDAHTFQLPPNSCLVDASAEAAFGRFVAAFAHPRNVRHSGTHASSSPASGERPAVHRLTIVLDSDREGLAETTTAAAQRAVNLSATMPASVFIERMQACIAAVASGGEVNLDPDPAIDLASGPDRTATVTLSIDPDGTRRVIEDPISPGSDLENETDL